MEENEEFDSDFNKEGVPISESFWKYMESYWHNHREFPESPEDQLKRKADLVGGKVPSSQLPSYVDDVLEFDSFENLPNPGEKGKIYVLINNNSQYRWSDSGYVQLNSDMNLVTTNTVQHVIAPKFFDTYAGGNWNNNTLNIYAISPVNPAITFYKEGENIGQLKFDGTIFTFTNSNTTATLMIRTGGFVKAGSSVNFVLTGDGGHRPISDFVLLSDLGLYHKRDLSSPLNNASDTHTNQTWFEYNWADIGRSGSVINFSGLSGGYSTEFFTEYGNGGQLVGARSRNGDTNTWNDVRWLNHSKSLIATNIGQVDTTLDAYLPNGGFITSYSTGSWGGADRPLGASYGGYIKHKTTGEDNNLDLYYNNGHNTTDSHRLWFRTKNNLGNTEWFEFWNSGNFNPDTKADINHTHSFLENINFFQNTDLNDELEVGKFKYRPAIMTSSPNLFPAPHNANGILSISTWSDLNYGHELGFSGNGNIYHRYKDTGGIYNWRKLLNETDALNYVTLPQLDGYFPIRPVQTGTDANNEVTSGLRADYIWTNTPESTIGTLLVERYSADWIAQTFTIIAGSTIAGNVWKRIRHSGTTWSSWVKMFSTQDFNPTDFVDLAQLNTKVNKSGDTMTGGLNINSNGSLGRWKGADNNTNYLIWRNYGDTKDIAYIGADGNSASGGGVGDGFSIVAPSGLLRLIGADGVLINGNLPWTQGNLDQSYVDYLAFLHAQGAALQSDLTNYIPLTQKAVPNGVATLDSSGLVPATQLPSYVDDVLEFSSLSAFPTTGETGKIYVATDTNQTYRWSGSTYIQIASGAVQSVNGLTGVVNLTKSDIDLGNVDNTADAIKKVLYANNASRLYAEGIYDYDGVAPYYGSLVYKGSVNRWRFEMSPATPADIEVAYADTAGSLRNVSITLAQLNSLTLEPGIYNAENYVPGDGLTGQFHYIIQLGSYSGGGFRSQIAVPYNAGINDSMYLRISDSSSWYPWERIAKNSDITSAINALNLSGTYATLNGVQTFTNTNTFSQSPVIPNGTLGTHAVNLNQLNSATHTHANQVFLDTINQDLNSNIAPSFNGLNLNNRIFINSVNGSYWQVADGSTNLFIIGSDSAINGGASNILSYYAYGSGAYHKFYQNVEMIADLKVGNNVIANGFIKQGGSANQFLKGDGSVDNNSYEIGFSKNTAFNKNFGTAAGTVVEGNDSRISNGQTAFSWGNHANADYAGYDFVNESIERITAEHINPNYPVLAESKVNTIIITDEFGLEYLELESELIPQRQITIINLSPSDVNVRRENSQIDTVKSRETTEYYITAERRLIKKGSYQSADFLN